MTDAVHTVPGGEAAASAPLSYAPVPSLLSLAALALGAFAPAVLGDGDTWSHVAAGDWMLDHRAVPHVDPFSHSFAGAPWVAHEWLSEVALALAHRGAGWAGVTLLTGLAAAGAIAIVSRRVARELEGPAVAVVLLLAFMLLAPGLLARPHILALPCLALWFDGLMTAGERGRAPSLWLAPVMLLWANLHGGFLFGLALAPLFALEALIAAPPQQRLAVARGWLLFGLASLIAALATPFGVEGLLFPLRLMSNGAISGIGEWRAQDFSRPGAFELALLALLGFALLKPLRLPPLRVALLLGLAHMSLQHARHEMLFAMIVPMLLARPMQQALSGAPIAPAPAPRAWWVGALIAALALSGARLALPLARVDSANAPMSALAAAPPELRAQPVLNGYGFGGYLIHAGVRPFIDGRADMYGEAFMRDFDRIQSGDRAALEAALSKYNIAWTIFPPEQSVVATLDAEPGWRRLYADAKAVVHVRIAAGP